MYVHIFMLKINMYVLAEIPHQRGVVFAGTLQGEQLVGAQVTLLFVCSLLYMKDVGGAITFPTR